MTSETSTERLLIRIEGPAIDEFYPAERVTTILLLLQKMLRNTLESSPGDFASPHASVEIRAAFPTRGSYEQYLLLIWEHRGGMESVVVHLVPAISAALGVLKEILPLFRSKKESSISVNDNTGIVVIGGQSTNVTINQLVVLQAPSAGLMDIAPHLGDGIDRIYLRSDAGEIVLDIKDAQLLSRVGSRFVTKRLADTAGKHDQNESRVMLLDEEFNASEDGEPIPAVIQIDRFNKVKNTGTLRVLDSPVLRRVTYPFQITGQRAARDVALAMAQDRTYVQCRRVGKRKLEISMVELNRRNESVALAELPEPLP